MLRKFSCILLVDNFIMNVACIGSDEKSAVFLTHSCGSNVFSLALYQMFSLGFLFFFFWQFQHDIFRWVVFFGEKLFCLFFILFGVLSYWICHMVFGIGFAKFSYSKNVLPFLIFLHSPGFYYVYVKLYDIMSQLLHALFFLFPSLFSCVFHFE